VSSIQRHWDAPEAVRDWGEVLGGAVSNADNPTTPGKQLGVIKRSKQAQTTIRDAGFAAPLTGNGQSPWLYPMTDSYQPKKFGEGDTNDELQIIPRDRGNQVYQWFACERFIAKSGYDN